MAVKCKVAPPEEGGTLEEIIVIRALSSAVLAIAVDANCDLLATGGEDKMVRLWSLKETKDKDPSVTGLVQKSAHGVFYEGLHNDEEKASDAMERAAERRWLDSFSCKSTIHAYSSVPVLHQCCTNCSGIAPVLT